jgi:hypothetical protein
MIAAKNRKSQCKEAGQLFGQLETGCIDEFEAFAQKYSNVAVKRILLYHFGNIVFIQVRLLTMYFV